MIPQDEFKPIPGYPHYQINREGQVLSLHVHRILKPTANGSGHLQLRLYENGDKTGDTLLVHRLVLLAFVGPCPEGLEGLHLDGIPANNSLPNLKWGIHSENVQQDYDTGVRHKSSEWGRRMQALRVYR